MNLVTFEGDNSLTARQVCLVLGYFISLIKKAVRKFLISLFVAFEYQQFIKVNKSVHL